ncbi:hypothetical protein MTR67_007253 [Solanum verrucosum]|uniref:Reverse transcriptase RNase H-like domain-containing protein n=1 Tax=Solanum verrucosum TaxID=315347 RepID=A0AAF0TEW9_SOLVR|nr:hypothetical protein MTR67_007253 [Solanum verrucosum]
MRSRPFNPSIGFKGWVRGGLNYGLDHGPCSDVWAAGGHPQTPPTVRGSPYGLWVVPVGGTCNFLNLHSGLSRIRSVTMGFYMWFLKDFPKGKLFYPVYYASKTLNVAQKNYTVMEQEVLGVMYAYEKFRAYLLGTKDMVHTNHASIRSEGCENQVADHLSRLETNMVDTDERDIVAKFPYETVMRVTQGNSPWVWIASKVPQSGYY